jgi:hypothetical protein
MSVFAEHYLSAAVGNITGARRYAARCQQLLHLAAQLDKMPEGFVDLFEDVVALQGALGRLHAQLEALANEGVIPAEVSDDRTCPGVAPSEAGKEHA